MRRKETKPRSAGRPTLYTDALATRMIDLVAEGVPIHRMGMIAGMPKWRTIMDWKAARPEFAAAIEDARKVYADRIAHEVVEIADSANPETMRGIEHARTKIDARKWSASVFDSERFGNRKRLDIAGGITVHMDSVDADA